MRVLPVLVVSLFLASSAFAISVSHLGVHDPCDPYGDCVSSSIRYIRSNPDGSLFLGDSFSVPLSVTTGRSTTGYSVSWSYSDVFEKSGSAFVVIENQTGTFSVEASVTFTGSVTVGNTTRPFTSTLTAAQSVTVVELVISLRTRLVNVTDSHGFTMRNVDGTFYRNDSLCDSWNATFRFAAQRPDIKINVSSVAPSSLRVLNYSAGPPGRTGRFCYVVLTGSAYRPYNVTLVARALNWQGVSLALKEASQPFAVVRYDPKFTTYSYMEYRNSTAPSSLERPWVLFVRYDGNVPGYSYAGDGNTRPFNGNRTLAERAYFDSFRFSTVSYQPFTTDGGVLEFHVTNSTGTVQYDWVNAGVSAPLYYGNRIEKYTFQASATSLSPLLAKGFVYQNVTMIGCWHHEDTCDLKQNYWLVPFLWSGRLNIVSVNSNGNPMPNTPISLTIHNPSPLDDWLTNNFEHVFGNDSRALGAFEQDLYPTNQSMTFSGTGRLSLILNQTSLAPPQISITAGGTTLAGNFDFTPTLVDDPIESVPSSLNGTIFYANATVPSWSYNMVQGSLTYLPIATTIDHPTTFLELLNSSSGWIAGNTTAPQTPSAFASQQYGFWPMGENLILYVNTQGGGINLLGTQKIGPDEYQASFYIEPWSGGISSARLVEGDLPWPAQSTLSTNMYASPLPTALTDFYSITYPGSGLDAKAVFTNVWGAATIIDLGAPSIPTPSMNLIPTTTMTVFGVALIAWAVLGGMLKSRKTNTHD